MVSYDYPQLYGDVWPTFKGGKKGDTCYGHLDYLQSYHHFLPGISSPCSLVCTAI